MTFPLSIPGGGPWLRLLDAPNAGLFVPTLGKLKRMVGLPLVVTAKAPVPNAVPFDFRQVKEPEAESVQSPDAVSGA